MPLLVLGVASEVVSLWTVFVDERVCVVVHVVRDLTVYFPGGPGDPEDVAVRTVVV